MDGLYFITGMPRSRTAWMANLMTWGASFCHHDLWHKTGGSMDLLCETVRHTGASWVGVSDPVNALLCRDLIKRFPQGRWLILERDPEKVKQSWEKLGWSIIGMHGWERKLTELRHRAQWVHSIDLDAAEDEAVFEAAQFLIPSFWDRSKFIRRLALLRDLNVQVHDLANKVRNAQSEHSIEEVLA